MTFFLFLEGQLTQQNSQANTITKHTEIRVFPPPPVDDAPREHSLVLFCIDFDTAVYRETLLRSENYSEWTDDRRAISSLNIAAG